MYTSPLRLDCCILEGIKHWMEKENQFMLCGKNESPNLSFTPPFKP